MNPKINKLRMLVMRMKNKMSRSTQANLKRRLKGTASNEKMTRRMY